MKIYVGNISFDSTEAGVRDCFSEYGQVSEVNLITDRESGRPRGFGFVEMPNDQEGREAISSLDGKDLDGRSLKVNEARPKTERSGGGGGGGRKRW